METQSGRRSLPRISCSIDRSMACSKALRAAAVVPELLAVSVLLEFVLWVKGAMPAVKLPRAPSSVVAVLPTAEFTEALIPARFVGIK